MISIKSWLFIDYDVDVSGKGDAECYFETRVNGKRLEFTVGLDRDGYAHLVQANFANGDDIPVDDVEFAGDTWATAVAMVIDCVREHGDQ